VRAGEALGHPPSASSPRSAPTWACSHRWGIGLPGKKRAAVAVGHSILVIAWHLLTGDYQDLGGDYFAQRDSDRQRHSSGKDTKRPLWDDHPARRLLIVY